MILPFLFTSNISIRSNMWRVMQNDRLSSVFFSFYFICSRGINVMNQNEGTGTIIHTNNKEKQKMLAIWRLTVILIIQHQLNAITTNYSSPCCQQELTWTFTHTHLHIIQVLYVKFIKMTTNLCKRIMRETDLLSIRQNCSYRQDISKHTSNINYWPINSGEVCVWRGWGGSGGGEDRRCLEYDLKGGKQKQSLYACMQTALAGKPWKCTNDNFNVTRSQRVLSPRIWWSSGQRKHVFRLSQFVNATRSWGLFLLYLSPSPDT